MFKHIKDFIDKYSVGEDLGLINPSEDDLFIRLFDFICVGDRYIEINNPAYTSKELDIINEINSINKVYTLSIGESENVVKYSVIDIYCNLNDYDRELIDDDFDFIYMNEKGELYRKVGDDLKYIDKNLISKYFFHILKVIKYDFTSGYTFYHMKKTITIDMNILDNILLIIKEDVSKISYIYPFNNKINIIFKDMSIITICYNEVVNYRRDLEYK